MAEGVRVSQGEAEHHHIRPKNNSALLRFCINTHRFFSSDMKYTDRDCLDTYLNHCVWDHFVVTHSMYEQRQGG